jgi:hypothetical protein
MKAALSPGRKQVYLFLSISERLSGEEARPILATSDPEIIKATLRAAEARIFPNEAVLRGRGVSRLRPVETGKLSEASSTANARGATDAECPAAPTPSSAKDPDGVL